MLHKRPTSGFTLIELVITVTVLAILTLGVVPLVTVATKRQKEAELRDALRTMREAIDQFHREALAGAQQQINQQQQGQQQNQRPQGQNQQQAGSLDPRIRVYISDATIFSTDNPDRYPPDLETLTKGVSVLPFALPAQLTGGQGLNGTPGILEKGDSVVPKTKIYLRQIPIDPMTGQRDWDVRSCYDAGDSSSTAGENVFDVHSKSKEKALNGEKYSDW